MRLCAGHADESGAGDRSLRRDQQGAWLPLRFPGKAGAYASIYQVTESAHFANAALWAATTPRCGLEAFNITNGDYFRWNNLWPKLAAAFDMPAGDVQTISLTTHMGDNAPLSRVMTE